MTEYTNYFKMMSPRSEKTALPGTSGENTNMMLVCSRESASPQMQVLFKCVLHHVCQYPLWQKSRRQTQIQEGREMQSVSCVPTFAFRTFKPASAPSWKFTCQVDISTCVHPLQVVVLLYRLPSGSV